MPRKTTNKKATQASLTNIAGGVIGKYLKTYCTGKRNAQIQSRIIEGIKKMQLTDKELEAIEFCTGQQFRKAVEEVRKNPNNPYRLICSNVSGEINGYYYPSEAAEVIDCIKQLSTRLQSQSATVLQLQKSLFEIFGVRYNGLDIAPKIAPSDAQMHERTQTLTKQINAVISPIVAAARAGANRRITADEYAELVEACKKFLE